MKSSVKLIAKAPKPRIVSINSPNVFGTSSETTSSVTANAKTASLKPSMRDISWLRQRNFLFSPMPLSISLSRIILSLVSTGSPSTRLLSRSQRGLHNALQFLSALFVITNKALDDLSTAIENEGLRNILSIGQVLIDQFI